MSRMQHLSERRIRVEHALLSDDLLEKVASNVLAGRSVVILGPQSTGKQFFADRTQNRLRNEYREDECLIVGINCSQLGLRNQQDMLIRLILNECPEVSAAQAPEDLDSALDCVWKSADDRPVFLLMRNLDRLSPSLTRTLLLHIRKRTQETRRGPLQVLLTGSTDLTDLTLSADSEFTADDYYFIKGADRDIFRQECERLWPWRKSLAGDNDVEVLYRYCNGSLVLLHPLLSVLGEPWCVAERRAETPLTDLLEKVSTCNAPLLNDALVPAFRRAEAESRSVVQVDELLRDKAPLISRRIRFPNGLIIEDRPTDLEVTAIAMRSGNALEWQSPLARELAERHFNPWRLGDAFGCHDNWSAAGDSYQWAVTEGWGFSDSFPYRPNLAHAARSAESHLEELAIAARCDPSCIEKLLNFGKLVAKYLIGFDDCRLVYRKEAGTGWIPENPTEHALDLIGDLLETADRQCRILTPTDPSLQPFLRVIPLRTEKEAEDHALLLDSSHSRNPVTGVMHDRLDRFAEVLQRTFAEAVEGLQKFNAHRFQENLITILPDLIQRAGSSSESAGDLLKTAGVEVQKRGYRRVMFSLVDQANRRIRGIADCCPTAKYDLAENTNYPLLHCGSKADDSPNVDIQQLCVAQAASINVAEASLDECVNQEAVRMAELKALLLVPLIAEHNGLVLGTMHIERQDRGMIGAEEQTAIEFFAEQLAKTVEVAQRMDVLEECLDVMADPVLFVERDNKVAFANQPAHTLFGVTRGWDAVYRQPIASLKLPVELTSAMDAVRKTRQPLSLKVRLSVSAAPNEREYRSFVVHSAPVCGFRQDVSQEPVGGIALRFHDVEDYERLLAFSLEFSACTTIEQLFAAFVQQLRILGHQWARIYTIDPRSGALIGREEFGIPNAADRRRFIEGETRIASDPVAYPISWKCIWENRALCYQSVGDILNGPESRSTSYNGMEMLRVRIEEKHPPYLLKSDGEQWLDLPLSSQEPFRRLGKVSMHLPDGFSLERFQWLQLLVQNFSTSLAAFEMRKAAAASEELHREAAQEEAVFAVCHRLQSRVTSLETLARRFEISSPEQLPNLLQTWAARRTKLNEILQESTRRLRPLQLQWGQENLAGFLTEWRNGYQLGSDECELWFDGERLKEGLVWRACFDHRLFEELLDELWLNSRKAIRNRHDLRIRLSVSETFEFEQLRHLCIIEYSDNGPGIPPSLGNRIFERFTTEWDSESHRGTGLGMPLVRRILKAHSGNISLVTNDEDTVVPADSECRPLSGAAFRISFPRFNSPSDSAGQTKQGYL